MGISTIVVVSGKKQMYYIASSISKVASLVDAYTCIATKLDVREFNSKNVPADVKLKILEAARLTGSGMNVQHWRFILAQGHDQLKQLAEDSTTGAWVEGSNFAVIVLTNPRYPFHLIDAGRVAQDMQLAAWNFGVASRLFTGVKDATIRRDFNIPSITLGFGYPAKKIAEKKNRKPLGEIVFLGKYDNRFDPQSFGT